MRELIYVNKLVSKILRHEIEKYDITYNNGGWIKLDDLLEILHVVYGCNDVRKRIFILLLLHLISKDLKLEMI